MYSVTLYGKLYLQLNYVVYEAYCMLVYNVFIYAMCDVYTLV